MFVNILKSNHPFVILFIILLAISLWFFSFIDPVGVSIPADSINAPLYQIIANNIALNSRMSIFVGFLLVVIQGFILVYFNKKFILINNRTYLPAFFYIFISSSIVFLQRLNPAIIGTLLITIAINFIFSTYRENYGLNKIYLAGFFIALSSLFWAPFAGFFFMILISLILLRPVIGREWIVGILGFLTPFLFVFVYYFVFTDMQQLQLVFKNFIASFYLFKESYTIHFSYYILIGFLLLLVISASYTTIMNYQKKKIKTRKYFEIYWWIFILGILLYSLLKNVSYEVIYLLAFPISFLLTDYFYSVRNRWYLNTILFILIGIEIYIQVLAH